jgi:hypothetical protein
MVSLFFLSFSHSWSVRIADRAFVDPQFNVSAPFVDLGMVLMI